MLSRFMTGSLFMVFMKRDCLHCVPLQGIPLTNIIGHLNDQEGLPSNFRAFSLASAISKFSHWGDTVIKPVWRLADL